MADVTNVRESGIAAADRRPARRRLYMFIGAETISGLGSSAALVATSLLVYDRTHSVAALGSVWAVKALVRLFFSPLAGAIVDRSKIKTILMITGSANAVVAASLAWAVHVGVWFLFALIGLLQLIQGFDSPATNSLIATVVDKGDLQRVNGYARSAGNIVSIAGPALGGALYALAGAGIVFIFNGLSFALVLFFVAALRVPRREHEASARSSVWTNSAAGLRYARSDLFILAILCLAVIDSMVGRAVEIVMVPLTTVTAHMGSSGLGIAYSALTFGAVAGALMSTRIRKLLARPANLIVSYAALAVPLVAVAVLAQRIVILVCMFAMGFVMDIFAVSLMTTFQRHVSPDYLGRVIALYGSALALGALPLAFGISPIVSVLGVRGTFAVSGILIAGTYVVLAVAVRRGELAKSPATESA